MSLPLFYEPRLNQHADEFVLDEVASKHIIQVLRMQKGELLQLTDGAGLNVVAAIVDDHKKKCAVQKRSSRIYPPAEKKITVAISPVKNASRFEWFLEKATEIGVTEIIPLICARTEKLHFRHERMNHILISAMLQSGQYFLPKLHDPASFSSIVMSNEFQLKLIAHCIEGDKKQTLNVMRDISSVIIFIGPEGDFTNEEVALAIANNCMPVSLGVNRLRTETAGVVAAALLKQSSTKD